MSQLDSSTGQILDGAEKKDSGVSKEKALCDEVREVLKLPKFLLGEKGKRPLPRMKRERAPKKAPENAPPLGKAEDKARPRADEVLKVPAPDLTAKAAYEKARPQADPVLAQAAKLLKDDTKKRIPKATSEALEKAEFHLDAALRQENYPVAIELLAKYKGAAQAVLDVEKGMAVATTLKKKQVDAQIASYDEIAPLMKSVKKGLLPDGQAQKIETQDYSAGLGNDLFKTYLTALKTLEASKKGVNLDQPVPKAKGDELKTNCQELIAKAEAYLLNYEKNTNDKLKKDKASLSMKRYCEEGKLAAFQYMIALDFDSVGKPTADNPWDEATAMRAASVNAKIKFHQAYEQATSLKETGGSGASDSLWITGGDIDATGNVQARKRTAIFKPFEGESPPTGSTDKPGAGAAKEALACANAKLFASMTGIDLGVPETSVVSVNRYAIKGGMKQKGATSSTDEIIGSAQANAGAKEEVAELPNSVMGKVKPKEVQKIALLDIMSLSVDRHSGNLMANIADDGSPSLVPIDHGGTLPSRNDFSKVKNRMAGMDVAVFTAAPINKLLTIPASYEPFDPEISAQLDLLDPEEMEKGMKRQRDAMDQVHPGLGAGAKVGDDSFHMSKRAMMFTKKAAKVMGPAEIQIALSVHGEELFDATDGDVDALIDLVIAEAAPKKKAYQEIFGYPDAERQALFLWLQDNGWALATETNANDTSAFVMKNPDLALKLYKTKTANPNPIKVDDAPKSTAPKAADKQEAKPDDATQKLLFATFPYLKAKNDEKPFTDKLWKDYAYHWKQINGAGGMKEYAKALKATGAKEDESVSSIATALVLWAKFKDPAFAPLLQGLPPNSDEKASALLHRILTKSINKTAAEKQQANLKQVAGTVDDAAAVRASMTETLKKIEASLAGWPVETAPDPKFGNQLNALKQQEQTGDPAATEEAARLLHAELAGSALDAIGAKAKQVFQSVENILPKLPAKESAVFKTQYNKVLTYCFKEDAINSGKNSLEDLKTLAAAILAKPVPSQAAAAVDLPNFSWELDVPSAIKKQAVAAGLFKKDKDTGMTDALKPVHSARKEMQAAIDKNASDDKKKTAVEAAQKAYDKFKKFADGKLRSLSLNAGWSKYCDSAVALADEEIEKGKELLGLAPVEDEA